MSEHQKSRSLAIVAGAVVLGTGPLAVAFLVRLGAATENGGLAELSRLVTEGGRASFGVLFAGALASLMAAVLTGISVRRPALPSSAALVPFVLPVLAAAGGVDLGMPGALALAQPTFLVASSGELASLCVLALAIAAAGALAVSVATAVNLAGPDRGGRLLTLLGSLALALSLGATAAQAFAVRRAFLALARASTTDRLALLSLVIDAWQVLNRVANVLLMGSVLVAVVGAVVLSARAQRAAGLSAAAALLVAAVGIRGFNAISERALSTVAGVPLGRHLMTLEGHAPGSVISERLNGDQRSDDRTVLMAVRRLDARQPWLGIELDRGLSPAALLRALQTAHFVHANVELVGDAPKPEVEVPPLFVAALAVAGDVQLVAPVRVLFVGEPCAGCEGNLKDWTPGAVPRTSEFKELPGVEFAWAGDIEALVHGSLTALSHQHVLVVRVPPPAPPPVLSE